MAETPLDQTLEDGDVISIAGLYADGTCEYNNTPPALYVNKPEKHFRVKKTVDGQIQLIALNADGTEDRDWLTETGGFLRHVTLQDLDNPPHGA